VSDPLWFKDAIFYQLRIPSFYDSDGDGIGDLRGLARKLDYLQDLGVNTLWLLPFYPSPLRDDGYDIAGYEQVHPDYGTLRDFRAFLREAHRRGLRVVTELVMNHTSDQHPWFQRARRAPPGSRWRSYYVWSDDASEYAEARIIFKDFEHSNWTWDPVAGAHYWHRFYSHQPDLNFDSPDVRRELKRILDFWFDMGVDGMRLDAIPYLYEREGTSCENLPETHAFLKELRAHLDSRHTDRMLLAEANQWPEDAVAYFGKGDECHMAFHFPIMPRLYMALHQEDRYPILDILEQTPAIPETCQWAIFLRNHDELTLEMVTDEERDYMWRVYARDPRARINLGIRRRLAPLMANSRRKIELMNALLFSLPGTPILYYGDEIGMGDNIYLGDRNAVRTPMQWSPDRNAGFSRVNPQRLFLPVITDPEYHYETVNVETQQANPSSLLWWTKRILALRREYRAFGRGTLEPRTPSNRRVLAFLRRYEDEVVLVVANLSRFAQYVELDLHEFQGYAPVELFGHVEFPPVGDLPYLLTLGPHAFYWFALQPPRRPEAAAGDEAGPPLLEAQRSWEALLVGEERRALERLLPGWLPGQRWFRSKAREVRSARITDVLLPPVEADLRLTLVEVDYRDGDPETYVVPFAFAREAEAPPGTLARVRVQRGEEVWEGWLKEASGDPVLAAALLETVARRRRLRGRKTEIRGVPGRGFRALHGAEPLPARLLGAEQSNTSFLYGERLVGKLLRRVEEGISPDLEILDHLTRVGFDRVPALAGHLELRRGRETPATLAIFQAFAPNEGEAWHLVLDQIEQLFEELVTQEGGPGAPPPAPASLLERARMEPPAEVEARLGYQMDVAERLGQRTAELHIALASGDTPAFAPEPWTPFTRRSFYQSLRNLAVRVFDTLRNRAGFLDDADRPLAEQLLASEERVVERLRAILEPAAGDRRIRIHGDYHLGQVLWTGRDFVILDFEGEPARSLADRQRKRSPLVDVAGMLRSYHYAVATALRGQAQHDALRPEDRLAVEPWAEPWYAWISAGFLRGYLAAAGPADLLPSDSAALERSLGIFTLEKALYEVGYELNNRPTWAGIPLRGVLELLEEDPS